MIRRVVMVVHAIYVCSGPHVAKYRTKGSAGPWQKSSQSRVVEAWICSSRGEAYDIGSRFGRWLQSGSDELKRGGEASRTSTISSEERPPPTFYRCQECFCSTG